MNDERKLTPKQRLQSIWGTVKMACQISPLMAVSQAVNALISGVLPFVTTYFAALTTTALAEAFTGDNGAKDRVILYVCLTGGLGLLSSIWSTVNNYIQIKTRYDVDVKLSSKLYHHFLNIDYKNYEDKEVTDLYGRAKDFIAYFPWFFNRVSALITAGMTMIAGVVALASVNAWLAVIGLIVVLPSVYIRIQQSRLEIACRKANVDTRRHCSMIEWSIFDPESILDTRLYGLSDYLIGLRNKLRDKAEKTVIDYQRQYVPKDVFGLVLQSTFQIGSLIWIVIEIAARRQSVGQFLLVQQTVQRLLSGVSGFVSALDSIDELANMDDYQKFMALPEISKGGLQLAKAPEEVKLSHLSFTYPGQRREVLNDINLTIKNGQRIAIVGENGAGKTTLLKLIGGLYQPTNGFITLDGKDLTKYNLAGWHKQLAILTQGFTKYKFATARENVLFGNINVKFNQDLYQKAINDAEAAGFIAKLPQQDDTYMDNWMGGKKNKGVRISGGQWQRLALARNFYRNAPIVILDEPTSAIDALAESRIFKRLFSDSGRTIIAVSHRLSTIKKADIIYMLADGKIVESGNYNQLIAKQGYFYNMFKSQM